jgi:hypothetical protein
MLLLGMENKTHTTTPTETLTPPPADTKLGGAMKNIEEQISELRNRKAEAELKSAQWLMKANDLDEKITRLETRQQNEMTEADEMDRLGGNEKEMLRRSLTIGH